MWQSMESAPKDGTAIQAEIEGCGSDYVIYFETGLVDNNGFECSGWSIATDQEPPECWTDGVCWEVNEDGVQSAQPTRWKPLERDPRHGGKIY